MTGGWCADPVDGSAYQMYRADAAALARAGGFGGDAVVVLLASRCHPVCGPLPTTRWQLPAVHRGRFASLHPFSEPIGDAYVRMLETLDIRAFWKGESGW